MKLTFKTDKNWHVAQLPPKPFNKKWRATLSVAFIFEKGQNFFPYGNLEW